MPPAAAKRLEQRSCVGQAVALGLNEVDLSLPVSLLGVQKSKRARITVPQLALREVEGLLCRVGGGLSGFQSPTILLECGERIGDVLKGGQHGASVLRGRPFVIR